VATAALFALPVHAIAQEAPDPDEAGATSVGEVVVTARRREERLADVPVAAAVLDANALAQRGGVNSAQDLFAGQAGVRFFDTTSPINSEVSVRASPTARATGSDPSVGLYRGGAYIGGGAVGGRSFSRLDLFDVGRVEILRGTQGALYGRNAVGGAVNIVSQQPLFLNTGWIDGRYAVETKSKQVQAVANLMLSDNVAIRVGLDTIDQDKGFFYDRFRDVYFDQQKSHAARGQIHWRGDDSDLNLMVEHMKGKVPAITYRVVIAPSAVFPHGVVQDEREYNWSLAPLATQNISSGQIVFTHQFAGATLSATTNLRDRRSYYQFDPDATNLPQHLLDRAAGLITYALDTEQKSIVSDTTRIFSQDVHLSGEAAVSRLSWLAGAEIVHLSSDSQVSVRHTPTALRPSSGTRSPVSLEYDSWAVYGSLGYDLTDALNLSAEGRYTSDDKQVTARRFDFGTGLPTGGAGFNVDARTKPDNISYNLIGSWKLPDNLLAYAKVGTSYRAGGFNTNLGVAGQPVTIPAAYTDETSRTYELGLKGQITPRIYVALAGFKTYTDDLIVQTDNGCSIQLPACPTLAVSFLINAGKAESWGLEAEAVGRFDVAGGDLRISLSGSRQDGEVTGGDYNGEPLPQVPNWIAGADINYRTPFVGDTTLFANLNYHGQWGGIQELVRPGTPVVNFPVSDITQINARLGVDFGHVEASAFVTNLTNESYSVFSSTTTQRLNTPRNWGVQLRYRW
jgi:iron complex outermembrane receptor protein